MGNSKAKMYGLDIENRERIKQLKNKHLGERCFVVGTGPSLNKTPVHLLKNEIIFGVNTLYNGINKWGISPQYYAIGDPLTFKNLYKEVLSLDTTVFIGDGGLEIFLSNAEYYSSLCRNPPILVPMLGFVWHDSNNFSVDLEQGAYNGDTIVIDICLQACYYMGFSEVYLLGIDLDYSGEHHFDGTVEKPASPFPSHLGNFSMILKSFAVCKQKYEEAGRKIYNATVGGKLELFERVELRNIV